MHITYRQFIRNLSRMKYVPRIQTVSGQILTLGEFALTVDWDDETVSFRGCVVL